MENIFEEVVLQSVMKDIMMGQSPAPSSSVFALIAVIMEGIRMLLFISNKLNIYVLFHF